MGKHLLSKLKNSLQQRIRRSGWNRFCTDTRGATAVEYAIMLLLIAVVIIAAVASMGQTLSGLFSSAVQGFR
jgi:Flp pilus assembly pilin Flp